MRKGDAEGAGDIRQLGTHVAAVLPTP
jgi:hypothetical protein